MQILANRTFGIIRCRKCRKPFKRKAANQKDCPDCSFYVKYHSGRLYNRMEIIEEDLKQAADASGNPKVWRAGECSQEFLRSLIPDKI